MSAKLIITHGLPGSGKSTLAQQIVDESEPGSALRVNRDDIRTALFGEEYHTGRFPKRSEDQVTHVQHQLIKSNLAAGRTVISDDTNLNPRNVLMLVRVAQEYNAKIEQIHVDTDIDVCKSRNAARGAAGGRLVPDEIIDRMAQTGYSDGKINRFVIGTNGTVSSLPNSTPGSKLIESFNQKLEKQYPIKGKAVVFVDLDGTLSNNARVADEAFGVPGERKNFAKFYRDSEHSPVNVNVLKLIKSMRDEDLNIFALTGRDEKAAQATINFLQRVGAPVSRLIMKSEFDRRRDLDFKPEALKAVQDEGFIVVHAIDDRQHIVDFFEKEGIIVSRVPEHVPSDPQFSPKTYDSPQVSTIFGTGHCIRCGQFLKNGGIAGVLLHEMGNHVNIRFPSL